MHGAHLQAPHNYFEGTVGDATCPIPLHLICSVALCDQRKKLSLQCWAQTACAGISMDRRAKISSTEQVNTGLWWSAQIAYRHG